ncbi:MAG: TonB family protein [Desulfatiglandaceae bacterium]
MGALSSASSFSSTAGPRWTLMVALSVVLHAGVIGSIVFCPGAIPTRRINGQVYEVDLVELASPRRGTAGNSESIGVAGADPAPADVSESKKSSSVTDTRPARRIGPTEAAEKPAVIAKRVVETPTPAAPKPKVKPSEMIDRAVSRIERKMESTREDPAAMISDAVTKIQREVEEKKKEESVVGDAIARLDADNTGSGGEEDGRTGGFGTSIRDRLYEIHVRDHISRNWTYPAALDTASGNLEAEVVVQVRSEGSIIDYSLRRNSSNPLFDQSVLKAVERSDPLPPLPEGYGKKRETIILNFSLRDLLR